MSINYLVNAINLRSVNMELYENNGCQKQVIAKYQKQIF